MSAPFDPKAICGAVPDPPLRDMNGVVMTVRCVKSAYHRKVYHLYTDGVVRVWWPGAGPLAGEWPGGGGLKRKPEAPATPAGSDGWT